MVPEWSWKDAWHTCLSSSWPTPGQSYSQHPNSCHDVMGAPSPSLLLHLLLQLAPGLLFFIFLAVSITHPVFSASGPLPLLFCMPGWILSPTQPHRTGFSASFGLWKCHFRKASFTTLPWLWIVYLPRTCTSLISPISFTALCWIVWLQDWRANSRRTEPLFAIFPATSLTPSTMAGTQNFSKDGAPVESNDP